MIEKNKPNKFILHISKCGTDTKNYKYSPIENDNAVILGLKGVKVMANSFINKEGIAFYEYLLACALLKGLNFDKNRLFDDINDVSNIMRCLSLSFKND